MSEPTTDQMPLQPLSPATAPYSLRFGILAGLVACVYSLIIYFAGQEYNRTFQWLGMIIPIVFAVMAMKAFKGDNGNRMRGRQGFKVGILLFVIYAIVIGIYMLLFMQVINPEYVEGLKEMTITQLEDRGLSDEMIEQQMAVSEMFFKPTVMMAMILISNLIIGAIISAIIAAILKTPKETTL